MGVLLERDDALAQLIETVDLAASRRGSLTVVCGEAGIGKSTLVDAMSMAARRADVRVVVTRSGPGAPCGPLIDVLTTAGSGRPDDQPPASPLVLVDRVAGAVESLAAADPLVLVVEDVHLADQPTLATLGALARRIDHLGCGLVVTARCGSWASDAEHCIGELITAGAWRIRLAPLSADGVVRLVADATGRPPGPRLRARLDGAAGNPLLVGEFIRTATAVGALVPDGNHVELDDGAGALQVDLPAGIAARLAALAPGTDEVLRVAAVLGPCAVDWLGPILESPMAAVRQAVCEATAAGFLDPASAMVRFRHDLVREALAGRVSAPSRSAIHRQLGRQLAAAGAPARLVSHHLELGSPTPDAETIRWMRRAATDAAGPDPGAAADLLGRVAAAMPADDPERVEVLAQRARALLWLGRPADCLASAAEALAQPAAAAMRAALRALTAEALLVEGRPYQAVDEIDRALASCDGGDERLNARLRSQAAMTRLWSYELGAAAADAEAALELAAAVGDPIAASRALNVSSRIAAYQADVARAVEAGEQAVERAGDVPAAVRGAPHLYLGLALINADRWERARRTLEEGCARCEALGAAWALPRYQGALATLSFFNGAWDDAIVASETGRLIAEDTGCRAGQGQVDAVVGLIAHHRGDAATATEAAHRAAAATTAPGADGSAVPYLCWLNALRAESGGDLARGVARLRLACALAFELGVPLVAVWLAPDLARLATADGQADVADWITREISPVADRAGTITAEATSRFCRSLVGREPDGLLAAAAGFVEAGRPLFAARAFDAAAGSTAAKEVAVDATRRAIETYERLGAMHDARAARHRLRALGARTGARGRRRRPVSGWTSLTPAEQEVARLVADGLTNGAIAARLFVSKRTVETHISRLYTKLQVTSRVAIAKLGRDATEPAPA